jgi:hypothetical protein
MSKTTALCALMLLPLAACSPVHSDGAEGCESLYHVENRTSTTLTVEKWRADANCIIESECDGQPAYVDSRQLVLGTLAPAERADFALHDGSFSVSYAYLRFFGPDGSEPASCDSGESTRSGGWLCTEHEYGTIVYDAGAATPAACN